MAALLFWECIFQAVSSQARTREYTHRPTHAHTHCWGALTTLPPLGPVLSRVDSRFLSLMMSNHIFLGLRPLPIYSTVPWNLHLHFFTGIYHFHGPSGAHFHAIFTCSVFKSCSSFPIPSNRSMSSAKRKLLRTLTFISTALCFLHGVFAEEIVEYW